MSDNRPVHEIRSGAVKAAIWANETRNGIMYSATFDRRYKDGEEWRSSHSFGLFDMIHLIKCAADAQVWVRRAGGGSPAIGGEPAGREGQPDQ